ncbi:discoidin domain-containing protein [Paenibacillus sp. IB182496]|uniref:Discoidin domain-containing protein n=1 Tax=Paenibacillus sabuli TaxID=2772509 RepID=A0A927GPQ6_9BACL|nr:discoidin domain-containing protein [Paenibacillus sabuli]MBD2843573.1 discoidin domain-containing protein [Paenibacillus sabuli]
MKAFQKNIAVWMIGVLLATLYTPGFWFEEVQAESGELVKNPSFEQGTANWNTWGQNANFTVTEEVYRSGQSSLQVELNGGTAGVIQNIQVSGGSHYRFGMWVKGEPLAANGAVTARLTVFDGNGTRLWDAQERPDMAVTGNADWTYVEEIVTMPDEAVRVQIQPYFRWRGTFWIDDVVWKEYVPLDHIELSPAYLYLDEEDSVALEVVRTPVDATDSDLTWSSSHPDVATVNEGVVTGTGPGGAVIRAVSSEGIVEAESVVVVGAAYPLTLSTVTENVYEDQYVQSALPTGDGEANTYTYRMLSGPKRGKAHVYPDGNWIYFPDRDYFGEDAFRVLVEDEEGGMGSFLIATPILPVNDPPSMADEAYTVTVFETIYGQSHAHDLEQDEVIFSVYEEPDHGTLVFHADGNWSYQAGAHIGQDQFKVELCDLEEACSNATVTIYSGPDAASLMDALELQHPDYSHPRLFATSSDFAFIRNQILEGDPFSTWYADVEREAIRLLNEPIVQYNTSQQHGSGNFLNTVARPMVERIQYWGFMYQISGDDTYFERAWDDLEAAADFSDWNPSAFLGTAELSFAFALAYDWFYSAMTVSERELLREAVIEKAFEPARIVYLGLSGTGIERGWFRNPNNKNAVVNSSLAMAALAFGEEATEAGFILQEALKSIQMHWALYDALGGGEEGPTYWAYASKYWIDLLATLGTALGTDYGFSAKSGLQHTGHLALNLTGPTGASFNYSDATASNRLSIEGQLWLANRFLHPELGWFVLQNDLSDVRRLLWANPGSYASPNEVNLPKDAVYNGQEAVAMMRSAWEDPYALYIGSKGGDNQSSHGDLDIGSFVFDALGTRWAIDHGMQTYGSSGLWSFEDDAERWQYYKKRAEGHNTLVINPGFGPDQDPYAQAEITHSDFNEYGSHVVIDMTPAYREEVWDAKRGIALMDYRRRMLIQDEIQAKFPSQVGWFMHTTAGIEVDGSGKKAFLKRGDKRVEAEILSPIEASFTVEEAVPLSSSPQHPENDNLANVRKLSVWLEDAEDVTLTIQLTPYMDGFPPPPTSYVPTPLSEWSFSADQPVALSGIEVAGAPLAGFEPDRLYYEVSIPEGEYTVPTVTGSVYGEAAITVTQATSIPGIAEIMVEPASSGETGLAYYVLFKTESGIGIPPDRTLLEIEDVVASDAQYDQGNIPANAADGDLLTRWSALGSNQWIRFDLGQLKTVDGVGIAWMNGNQRSSYFTLQVSEDAQSWDTVYSGESSGSTLEFETYSFSPVQARYIRIVGDGNSVNGWNSINEVIVLEE